MKQIDMDKLFEIAGSDILPLEEQLHNFARLLRNNFELRLFFENQLIPAENKKKALLKVLPGPLPLFQDLISFIMENGMQNHILELAQKLTKLTSERLSITFVDVESPYPLSAADEKGIKRLAGGQVRLRTEHEPSLIGGIRFLTSDSRYCNVSIAWRINQLKERLTYA